MGRYSPVKVVAILGHLRTRNCLVYSECLPPSYPHNCSLIALPDPPTVCHVTDVRIITITPALRLNIQLTNRVTDIWLWRADPTNRTHDTWIWAASSFLWADVNWPEIIQMKGFYSFSPSRAQCIKPSTLCDGYINLLLFSSALNVPQTHHRESHEEPSHIEIADGIFPPSEPFSLTNGIQI